MLNKTDTEFIITDDSEKWIATHPLITGSNGPVSLKYKNDLLVANCGGYIGQINESGCVPRKIKDYHKAGTSVIEFDGFLPCGSGQVNYKQTYRYSNKRLKVTTDVNFPPESTVSRHFAVGSLDLPGKWDSFSVIPGAFHQAHGAQIKEVTIPKFEGKEIMLGHWHRPPLSVTFKRPNGTVLEVGTGSDVWRWEENLGYEPESGSYKIILTESGLKFIREPLACCEDFTPESRPYRYSWYLAWRENGANKKLPQHQKIDLRFDAKGELDTANLKEEIPKSNFYSYAVLDLEKLSWNKDQVRIASPYDYIRNIRTEKACWSVKSVMGRAKKIIRKLQGIEGLHGVIVRNLTPGPCYCASHVNKKHENGTAHWDVIGIFDFATWASNSCSDKLHLHTENDGSLPPSISGLFE
ncbi:MAG: hypothetical protein NE330_06045 [Lentisphaeraceae bacterium]|nr:hypothetical protein [Lentisphaeraceae bacterium]